MKDSIDISIIVPVYNCEPYLDDCIQSVIGQTFSSWELLLLNDGSSDGSGKICDNYKENKQIRVIHKENEGVSRTRNRGIQLAQGNYILFLDGDDTMEPDMLESMMNDLQHESADCAFCGLVHDYPDRHRNFPDKPAYFTTDGVGAIRTVLENYQATAGPVCKLFKKELLSDHQFPQDLTIGEDAVAVVNALLSCRKAVFHTKPFYHYNHHEGSLMTSPFTTRDLDLIKAYQRILATLPSSLKKEASFRLFWAHFHVFDKMIHDDSSWKKGKDFGIVSWIRKHFFAIITNPYVGTKRKIALCGLLFSRRLYRRFVL